MSPPGDLALRGTAIATDASTDALRPRLDGLADAVADVAAYLHAVEAARGALYLNAEGGDVGGAGTARALLRHVANYLAARDLGLRVARGATMVDVGSGTGALAAWVAAGLGARLHLVDRDPAVRAIATAAFPDVAVHAALSEVAPASAALVTGMEVVEHVAPREQLAFVRALFERVAPGGLLVVSTPDESGYLGGWSGYAPHIGPLDAPALEELLVRATGAQVRVWRFEGDAFHLGPVRRVVHPLANRAWTRCAPVVGPLAQRLARPAAALADRSRDVAGPALNPAVRVVPASAGAGTGLLGVVRAAG